MKEIIVERKMIKSANDFTVNTKILYGGSCSNPEYRKMEIAAAKQILNDTTGKLSDAIKAAEGRAKERTADAVGILSAIGEIEKRLNITKKSLDGVKITVDINAQDFPRAYKYTPNSTIFEAVFRGGKWRITDIYRSRTHAAGRGTVVQLTEAAKAAIIANFAQF